MSHSNNKGQFKPNIGVVTVPFYNNISAEATLNNLIDLLESFCNEVFIITGSFKRPGKKINIIRIKNGDKPLPTLFTIFKFILTDVRIFLNLVRISKKIDIVAFHMGARIYILSMLVSKLMGKKVIIFFFGSAFKSAKSLHGGRLLGMGEFIFPPILKALERFTLFLADQVAVESKQVIEFGEIGKYKRKISIYGALYIDVDFFTIKKSLEDKEKLVGYIGFLSENKGIMNLIRAMPIIFKKCDDVKFLIAGDGPLFNKIKDEIKNSNLIDKVLLVGWIPHGKVPAYLNESKLLVLPSYTEGVPGIIQEAMASGTPVLATPVGGIPDLIKDGETGFIMENNSPECIAENVIRALEHSNLKKIVKKARKLVEDEYTYEVMVRKCKNSLDELMKGKRRI